MRWLLPKFTIRRFLLMTAVACPLSVSLIGYTTGIRCPLCFSGETGRRYRCMLINETPDGQVEKVFGTPLGWYCRRCELQW